MIQQFTDENRITWMETKDGIRPKCLLPECNRHVCGKRYEKGWFTCKDRHFDLLCKQRAAAKFTTPGLENISAEDFEMFYTGDSPEEIDGKKAYQESYWIDGQHMPTQHRKTGKWLSSAGTPVITTRHLGQIMKQKNITKALTHRF